MPAFELAFFMAAFGRLFLCRSQSGFAIGGEMKKLKIELVEDWREAWKWSSMRILMLLAALQVAVPHFLPLLAEHWPDIAPWVMHFFPRADASVEPVIGFVLVALARLTKLNHGGEQ